MNKGFSHDIVGIPFCSIIFQTFMKIKKISSRYVNLSYQCCWITYGNYTTVAFSPDEISYPTT